MMSDRLIHIARDGKIFGQYSPERLACLVDSGQVVGSDFCYSDAAPEWVTLEEFLKNSGVPKYSRTKESADKPPASSERHDHRSGQGIAFALAGWIAFLLVLSASVGSGFWIAQLYGEMGRQGLRIGQLEHLLAATEKDYQKALSTAREVAQPGTVRGSVILRNDAGKRVAIPGAQVYLFARKAVEDHLEARGREATSLPASATEEAVEFFLAGFPNALTSTTTDASGRYEFQVSEPGEYVVCTSVSSAGPNGRLTRLWLVSFSSRDPLNAAVDITESNCVQQFLPSLMIVNGR